MSTKVWDHDTMFYEAEVHGTFVVATQDSPSVDLQLVADPDEKNAGMIVAKWPGLDSAGALTLQLIIADSADDAAFAAIWTSPVWTLAQAQAEMADFRFSLPTHSLRRFARISTVVGVAVASAGLLTAGIVK